MIASEEPVVAVPIAEDESPGACQRWAIIDCWLVCDSQGGLKRCLQHSAHVCFEQQGTRPDRPSSASQLEPQHKEATAHLVDVFLHEFLALVGYPSVHKSTSISCIP